MIGQQPQGAGMDPAVATEAILQRMVKSKTNRDFLRDSCRGHVSNKIEAGGTQVESAVSKKENLLSTILWVIAGAMVILAVVLVLVLKPGLPFSSAAAPTQAATPTGVAAASTTGEPAADVTYDVEKKVVRALNPHTEINSHSPQGS